ncbi:MAG: Gfo/Idh/MocA family oxidoreductase [Novibacillus thermophilus]
MNIGIISFAHMHANSYAKHLHRHPEAELTAIWDDDPSRGQRASDAFGARYYDDLDQFLHSDVDAVLVCSENAKHRDHVVKASQAGKHVLCEKPIATEIRDAEEMIDSCREHGVILQIAYPVRFAPSVERVRDMVQNGELGDILAINGTNHGQMPGGWFVQKEMSGGGAATDHIVHVMDLVRWMLNDEVKSVYAEMDTRFYDIDVEDCGIVSLEMESGTIVTIDPSWSRPKTFPMWGDVKMEMVGTKGTLSVDVLKQSVLYFNDRDGKVQPLAWAEDMDKRLIDDFLDCIKHNRAPFITGEDGLRTLEVVKAAYESHESKKVVQLTRR